MPLIDKNPKFSSEENALLSTSSAISTLDSSISLSFSSDNDLKHQPSSFSIFFINIPLPPDVVSDSSKNPNPLHLTKPQATFIILNLHKVSIFLEILILWSSWPRAQKKEKERNVDAETYK